MSKIGDIEPDAVGGDRNRTAHVARGGVIAVLGQVRLDERGQSFLSQDQIGRRAVRGGNRVKNQYAVILRVGDKEFSVLDPDTLGPAHGFGGGDAASRDGVVSEVRLPQHHVGGNAVGRGYLAPDQNAIVVGVGDRNDAPIGSHACRRTHAALGKVDVRGRKIRLAQDHIGGSQADRTRTVVEQLVGRLGESAGDVLENKDALVHRRCADAVRIDHEQHVAGVGDPTHASDQILARALILFCEGTLSDD